MPGKHVRFASANILYSPEPSTPSPSYSSSSLPSSSGPLTPPESEKSYSPYKYKALPQTSESWRIGFSPEPVRINPVLGLEHPLLVNYDLSNLPDSITTPRHHPLTPRVLSEPATSPGLPSLTLVSGSLPWTLTIHPSSPKPDAFVTVADVLFTLYRILRLNVTPAEYGTLPSREARRRVNASYEHRHQRIGDERERDEEKRKGVKRVDFLMGRNRFLGLSCIKRGPDVWELNVGA